MTLRAYGVGAAQGFAEWGDAKAFAPLVAYVEDEKNNEQARMTACEALGWVGTDADLQSLVPKVLPTTTNEAKRIKRACLLEAFFQRRVTGVDAKLVPLLSDPDEGVRRHAAIAIGHDGIDADAIAAVRAKIDDPVGSQATRIALLLGGTPADAELVATRVEASPSALEDLKIAYNVMVSQPPTDAALADGSLARWAANARVREWMTDILGHALGSFEYDNGPHTLTRVVLRAKLVGAARGGDANALLLLQIMKERGCLASLGAPLSPPSSDPR
jgi:HEAT repeat protein